MDEAEFQAWRTLNEAQWLQDELLKENRRLWDALGEPFIRIQSLFWGYTEPARDYVLRGYRIAAMFNVPVDNDTRAVEKRLIRHRRLRQRDSRDLAALLRGIRDGKAEPPAMKAVEV